MTIIENFFKNVSDSVSQMRSEIKSEVKQSGLEVKAEATKKLLGSITGYEPVIVYENGKAFLMWRKEDIPKVQNKLNSLISVRPSNQPKDLNVKFEPVLYPVIIRKIAPYAIALGTAGFILGYILKR